MRNTRIRLAIFTLATFGVGAAGIVALSYLWKCGGDIGADDNKLTPRNWHTKPMPSWRKLRQMPPRQAQKGNSKYDVLDWSSVTAAAPSAKVLAKQEYAGAAKYIDSAKPEKSLILLRISDKSMPPGGKGLCRWKTRAPSRRGRKRRRQGRIQMTRPTAASRIFP